MRRTTFAGVLALGVLALTDCNCDLRPTCELGQCRGCCDKNGACVLGNTDVACGAGGTVCTDCAVSNRICVISQCTPKPGGGSDGGAADSGCAGKCSGPGPIECVGATGFRSCQSFGQGCWDWVPGQCAPGTACEPASGKCLAPDGGVAPGCLADGGDVCSLGQRLCANATSVQYCQFDPVRRCYGYAAPVSCNPGEVCTDPNGCVPGAVDAGCTNQCSFAGQRRCVSGTDYEVCQQQGTCLGWGSTTPCTGGMACQGGSCVTACTNKCSFVGQRQCATATSNQVCQQVGQCLDWSFPTSCNAGETCTSGNCVAGCTSNCSPLYTSQCNAQPGGIDLCFPANDAGCLQWRSANCGDDYNCTTGKCVYKANVPIGATCTSHASCNTIFTDAGISAGCLTGFPSGYCVQVCDDEPNIYRASYWPCSSGRCTYLGQDRNGNPVTYCMSACNAPRAGQDVCRTDYVCERSGADAGFCWPNCRWNGFDAGFCATVATCTDAGYCQ